MTRSIQTYDPDICTRVEGGVPVGPDKSAFLIALQRLALIERRWTVTTAAALGMMAGFFAYTTISVFMIPLMREFDWQKADVSSAYTVMSGGAAAGGLLFGYVADRFNTRNTSVLGAVAIGLAFVLLSLQQDIDHFHLLHLIIGFFGCASLYTPLITTVGLWFERRRGLSLGIVTAGGTVGQGITPLVVQPLIDRLGWQGAYLTLGIVFLCLIAPLMTFVEKPSPGHVAVVANDTSSWSLDPRLSVGWLSLAAFLCCVTMASALVHLVPFMIECGRSPIMAGSLFMTVMLAGAVGRLFFGLLSDRTGALVAYMLASLMQTTMLYWFVVFDSLTPLFFVGATFGFGYAGVMTTVNLSVREAVPARSAGFSTAIVSVFAWAGMGAGGGLTGYFFDATGSYVMPFAGAVLVGVANLIVLSLLLIVLSVRNRGCAVDSGASA